MALALALAALSGCETTGDPRRGGLFAWSETQAVQRQAEKRSAVGDAQAELDRESSRSGSLSQSGMKTDRQIAVAKVKHQTAENRLRAQQAALLACPEPPVLPLVEQPDSNRITAAGRQGIKQCGAELGVL